jgi:hypothetical protein
MATKEEIKLANLAAEVIAELYQNPDKNGTNLKQITDRMYEKYDPKMLQELTTIKGPIAVLSDGMITRNIIRYQLDRKHVWVLPLKGTFQRDFPDWVNKLPTIEKLNKKLAGRGASKYVCGGAMKCIGFLFVGPEPNRAAAQHLFNIYSRARKKSASTHQQGTENIHEAAENLLHFKPKEIGGGRS